jgi:hypothetical protein
MLACRTVWVPVNSLAPLGTAPMEPTLHIAAQHAPHRSDRRGRGPAAGDGGGLWHWPGVAQQQPSGKFRQVVGCSGWQAATPPHAQIPVHIHPATQPPHPGQSPSPKAHLSTSRADSTSAWNMEYAVLDLQGVMLPIWNCSRQ